MAFSERLIELRKQAGLSQESLAERLNISRQAISKWERGESTPDMDNLKVLGQIYNVSMDYLLLGKNETVLNSFTEKEKKPLITAVNKYKGYIWAAIGICTIILLFYVTNIWT